MLMHRYCGAGNDLCADAEDCFLPYKDNSRNILRLCECSEAIHADMPDCFVPRNDGVCYGYYLFMPAGKSPASGRMKRRNDGLSAPPDRHIFAGRLRCFSAERTIYTVCPPTRHCERSEAIHADMPDCFVPRKDGIHPAPRYGYRHPAFAQAARVAMTTAGHNITTNDKY
jgi:hypothetical protein